MSNLPVAGKPAPAFDLPTDGGGKLSLKALKGDDALPKCARVGARPN